MSSFVSKWLMGGAAACIAYAYAVEPNRFPLTQNTLHVPGLPPAFEGYRIVHVSDLHAGRWQSERRLLALARRINALAPDLIALTGDFATCPGALCSEAAFTPARAMLQAFLAALHAPDGAVAVLGNHDYDCGAERMSALLARNKVHVLINAVHLIEREGDHLAVAGVDDALEGHPRLKVALDALPDGVAALLLAHEPAFARQSALTRRFFLQLSGHTHGGQVRLPLLPPPLPPMSRPYPSGRYEVNGMTLYTSRGIGMVHLPLRFLCPPDLAVFELCAAPRDG